MSTPIPGLRYAYDSVSSSWVAPGRASLAASTVVTPPPGGGGTDPTPPPPPPPPTSWDPTQLGYIPRPTGTQYVPLESLGVPLTGEGIRQAATMPATKGKVITLPNGVFEFIDYAQGDGGIFMHGWFIPGNGYARGLVGSGAGTVIQMKEMSSHFNNSTVPGPGSAVQPTTPNQYLCSTIQFYQVDNVEFGNMVVQGTLQPHLNHGIRINGANIHVHHVRFKGASAGSFNMPPGETYTLMVSGINPIIEDVELDGRRQPTEAPCTSTLTGVLGCTNTIMRRIWAHDCISGFGQVQYLGTGFTSEDFWAYRTGTGRSGNNGCHSNHEIAGGVIRHYRPHIILDSYWTNRTRSDGKFGHMLLLEYAQGANPVDPLTYRDFQIIEPVFDTWGGIAGGFALSADATITAYPQVIKNGITLAPVVRPRWWDDSPAINTSRQYWVAGTSGDASTWG